MKLTIGNRLATSFGILTLIALTLGGMAVYGLSSLAANSELIGTNRVPALLLLGDLSEQLMVSRAHSLAVFTHETQPNAQAGFAKILELRGQTSQQIDQSWAQLQKIPRTSVEGQAMQAQLEQDYKNWRVLYFKLDEVIGRLAQASDGEQKQALFAEYRGVIKEITPVFLQLSKTYGALAENNRTRTSKMIEQDRQLSGQLTTWSTIATLASLIIAIVIGWLITRSIAPPLRETSAILNEVAEGNMTSDISPALTQRSDEIGDLARAMQAMTEQLRDTITHVLDATSQVSVAASQIAQGSADLSQRTEQQASALEETASSMEELTSTIKQSADNARQANQLASAARNQAETGGQVVSQAIEAVNAINASSRKIADIIGVIDEIAFQTNLLALNAAVEAARAGAQGQGFAVVAGEVRKLAQRSADAAREIKGLITDSVQKVEDGSQLVEESGRTLKGIVGAAQKVSDIIAEISAAAGEQASGIEQVNQAILQMDQATQQNAALVEETAAASRTMGDQAQQLDQMMGFFKVA